MGKEKSRGFVKKVVVQFAQLLAEKIVQVAY
jgi:hypothetical protein